MDSAPFQDRVGWHCFGCGRLNDHGLQIKSRWDGDDVVCQWRPEPFHVGLPGRLQGGVVATAIVCHSLWTATATACRNEGVEIKEPMDFAYSTTSLHIEFLSPPPVENVLTLRARVTAINEDTASVSCSVFVDNQETTRARTEHLRIPLR
jgi:acyl-coenzyme A thioesterase PaaI-like protein